MAAAGARAQAALEIAEAAGEPSVACEALYIIGRVARNVAGDATAGAEPLERMVAVAERAGFAHWTIRGLLELGLIDRLTTRRIDRLERVRELGHQSGALTLAAVAELNIASMLLGVEQARAADLIATATQMSRRFMLPTLGFSLTLQALLRAIDGDRAGYDATIAELSSLIPSPPSASYGQNWSLVQGDPSVAFEALDAAWGTGGGIALGAVLPLPHRGLWALGSTVLDRRGASARARIAEEGFGSWENRGCVALAAAVEMGRQGRPDAAEAELQRFEHDFGDPQRNSWVAHLARVWAAPAAFADGWGRPVGWLLEARAFFAGLRLAAQVRNCDRLLRSLGQTVPRRGRGDATVPANLLAIGVTSREMDVLLLIANGLGNREIAERLHVSPRTVETHVAQLLAKTRTRTRLQLVNAARGMRTTEL